jgi:methylmalonyl-CoA mutase N-terminal domain/subunit
VIQSNGSGVLLRLRLHDRLDRTKDPDCSRFTESKQNARRDGERVIVGVNEHQVDEDIKEVSEEEQRRQRERVQQLRAERDSEAVWAALMDLEEAAKGNENVMLYIVDAVKGYAMTGEICNALRNVFGEQK